MRRSSRRSWGERCAEHSKTSGCPILLSNYLPENRPTRIAHRANRNRAFAGRPYRVIAASQGDGEDHAGSHSAPTPRPVVGTYRNYAGFGAAFDGVIPAAMRIFPDGSANWPTVRWVSYADFTPDGMKAVGPYPEGTRYVRQLVVRDGILFAQDGVAEPLFVAYEVDALTLEKRNRGYTRMALR